MKLRSGIKLLEDIPGTGSPIRRRRFYRIRIRMWLNKGEVTILKEHRWGDTDKEGD